MNQRATSADNDLGPMNRTAIVVSGLSKVFRLNKPRTQEDGGSDTNHWALRDVSFSIKKGLSVGIIGPNGSGKSTLLKVLSGVTKPSSGRVEVRGRIGSILDIGAGLHPELSGKDNILLHGQTLGFSVKEITPHVNDIIAFSELGDAIHEPVKNYSNGMFLRLAFSIIGHLPFDVYLFDEVLSVGDAKFMAKSKERIKELGAMGRTIVHVSHSLSELNDKDMYIMLEKGRLVDMDHSGKLLHDYEETGFLASSSSLHLRPVTVKDPEQLASNSSIRVTQFSMHQGEGQSDAMLQTDLPLHITVEYEKLDDTAPTDVVLMLKDVQGTPILLSSPFLNGEYSTLTQSGSHISRCVLPKGLLSSQVYRVSLLFLRNVRSFMEKAGATEIPATEHVSINTLLRLDDVVCFKPTFCVDGKSYDLSEFNLKGKLLLTCEWEHRKL
jgi:lipopolysaccharide transport system ATP-binding protein